MKWSVLLRFTLAFLIAFQSSIVRAEFGSYYIPEFRIDVESWDLDNFPKSFTVGTGSLLPPEGWVFLRDSASGKTYLASYKGLRTDPDDGSKYMYFDEFSLVPKGPYALGATEGVQESPRPSGPVPQSPQPAGKNPQSGKPGPGNQSEGSTPIEPGPSIPSEVGPGKGMGEVVGGAAIAGVGAGLASGIANEIVNRWIITDAHRANWAAAQTASNHQTSLANHQKDLVAVADGKLGKLEGKLFKTEGLSPQIDLAPHPFQSSDSDLVNKLTDIQNRLLFAPSLNPNHQDIRGLGLGLVEQSDLASVAGDPEAAEVFGEYAKLTADLLVGLDPVTGAGRSIYEAFTGKNLITNLELSDFERGAAVFGAVTFGFGQKVVKGISTLSKAAKAMSERLRFVKELAPGNSWSKAMQSGALRVDPNSIQQFDRFQSMIRSEQGLSEVSRPFHQFSKNVLETDPSKLFHYSDLAYETRNIKVPVRYGQDATQELSTKALDGYKALKNTDHMLVRQGVRGESRIALGGGQPQYWALDPSNAGSADFASRMGAYSDVPDFIEYGKVKEGAKYVVRSAPPGRLPDGRITPGGGLEAVVESGGVDPIKLELIPR